MRASQFHFKIMQAEPAHEPEPVFGSGRTAAVENAADPHGVVGTEVAEGSKAQPAGNPAQRGLEKFPIGIQQRQFNAAAGTVHILPLLILEGKVIRPFQGLGEIVRLHIFQGIRQHGADIILNRFDGFSRYVGTGYGFAETDGSIGQQGGGNQGIGGTPLGGRMQKGMAKRQAEREQLQLNQSIGYFRSYFLAFHRE
ncbi:MAG: hypothetical protein BWY71_00647 [Planctomycetes bacterium ADurb.Bin412]|nr:MAG: hypothetical protein BWY71_00647 [Planctomycetes bacterium ADurb.Bin412]